MDKTDIQLICEILKHDERDDLADLLSKARGELDESSTYGSYWNSTISEYLFYLPLASFHKARELSEEDRKLILRAVLYIYPHKSEVPEVRGINFHLSREPELDEVGIKMESKPSHEFAQEQLTKCEEKLEAEDFDGAISSAGSLLESVFAEIYKCCRNEEIDSTADLRLAYKKVKSLIKLSDEQHSNGSVQMIMQGLSSVICGMDAIRNQMGDRHRRTSKPWKRHAKLCVNSTKTVVEFLYETLEFQEVGLKSLYDELVSLLDSDKRKLRKDELLLDGDVVEYLAKCDEYQKGLIKNRFIEGFVIHRFRDSDIFFSAMEVFFEQLSKNDIVQIFEKTKNDPQACGLMYYLGLVSSERAELMTPDILEYLKSKKQTEAVSGEILF